MASPVEVASIPSGSKSKASYTVIKQFMLVVIY